MANLFLGKYPYFKPMYLPKSSRQMFEDNRSSPGKWRDVVIDCVKNGIDDVNGLTDVAFYLHHQPMIGTPISKEMVNFDQLVKEWNWFRKDCKFLAEKCYELPSLADQLNDLSVNAVGENNRQWEALRRMKPLFIEALESHHVDTRFRKFDFYDGMGRRYQAAERLKYQVIGLKELYRESAIETFKKYARTTTVKRALEQTEKRVHRHMDTVIRWVECNRSTADARIDSHTEIKYVKELYRLANQESPKSIFRCYKSEIVPAYNAIWK